MATVEPIAIIDIGSNSVRLVVYAGALRVPSPIFNEKVLAGLAKGLGETGRLSPDGRVKAMAALRRFKLLLRRMSVRQAHVLATAAVREAEDGEKFVREIKQLGFNCEVLSPEEEARLAGEGVLSAIPAADGIVGDLGGGSLELVEVAEGRPHLGISLALGVLRLSDSPRKEKAARELLRSALKDSGLGKAAKGRCFYMVGGSWRALARIDMFATDFPLPITHQYRMEPRRARELRKLTAAPDPKWSRVVAPARLATAPTAAMLLEILVEEIEPSELIVSTFGIREGLLFSELKPWPRLLDPLIEAARESGGGEHRFGQHGDLLDEWIAPLFDDTAEMRRLRLASCLLADVAWQATPNFRADRGIEMSLHGNWVGVTPTGRVIMAQALSSSFGRERLPDSRLAQLCTDDQLKRAHEWGLAIRLGQRLSGGVASVLKRSSLGAETGAVRLSVRAGEEALVGDAVKRRLQRLAETLDRKVEVTTA